MKKKLVLRVLAFSLVLFLGSGEALAAAATDQITTDQTTTDQTTTDQTTPDSDTGETEEEPDLEYSYNFIYTQPNNSVELSPSSVNAEAVVAMAYPIIVKNEGGYTSVNPNDNGAISIGRIQWHGNRAMQLMREIIETDPNKAYKLLGKELYEEVTNSKTDWSKRIVTTSEASTISSFLSQMSQSKAVQDKMAKADIAVYVNHGIALGIRNVPALIYFSDLENQGGYGRSSECAKKLISTGICSSYGKITLNELYLAAVANSVMGKSIYLGRRTSCYQACVDLGYTYSSAKDSVIPYVMNKFTTPSYVGEKWLQWALNVYGGANVAITNEYDAATVEAVKAFQKSQGMDADGQAGKSTLKALATLIIQSGKYNPGDNTVVIKPVTPPAEDTPSNPPTEDNPSDTPSDTPSTPPAQTQKTATITVSKTRWEANDTDADFALNAKSNHSESKLTYKSSDEKIVTVSTAGKVDLVGPGTATVTISQAATTGYKAATKTVTIIVYDDDVTKYTTPTTNLRYKKTGMKKNDIMWLQAALNRLNNADLLVDGDYGAATDKAVKAFQTKVGTTADGEVGPNTRNIMVRCLTVANSMPKVTVTNSKTGVTLKWDKNSNASFYKVHRKVPGSPWQVLTVINNINTLTFTDTTGTAGTTYNYAVQAYYTSGSLTVHSLYDRTIKGTKIKPVSVTTYPVPTRTLKVGHTGNDVKWMQQALNVVLGTKMPVDGQFGANTKKYVVQFQTKYGLDADGIFGPASRTKLKSLYDKAVASGSTGSTGNTGTNGNTGTSGNTGSTGNTGTSGNTGTTGSTGTSTYPVPTRTLKVGHTGNDVKWMQQALNTVLGAKMPVDGQFGANTKKYVVQFQTKYGLDADGIFGPASRTKLKTLYDKAVASGSTGSTGNTGTSGNTGSTGNAGTSGNTGSTGNNGTSGNTGTTGSTGTSTYPIPTRTLKKGSTGEDVKWMQQALNKVLSVKMPVDGQFGANTQKYVIQFQSKYGLDADGIFGPASRTKLQALYK